MNDDNSLMEGLIDGFSQDDLLTNKSNNDDLDKKVEKISNLGYDSIISSPLKRVTNLLKEEETTQ